MGSRPAEPLVINSDTCGVGISNNIPVEDNDGDSFLVYLPDDGCESRGFIGRYDDDVKFIVGEITYIFDLFFIVVIGRTDLYRCVFMKHYLTFDFIVHLHSPVVLAAL